jgi:NAD(P)-dependent dehydrogenase (short-subunit alcohol dehydrogenase family)
VTTRNVVVTGASSGIGAAVVDLFDHDGDTLWLIDRNPRPDQRPVVACDLADPSSRRSVLAQLPETIDVVVNAAGVSGTGGQAVTLAVNFYGLRDLTEQLVPRMRPGGSVINVASTAGWYWRDHLDDVRALIDAVTPAEIDAIIAERIPDGYTAYARSKEAVIVWTAMAAQDHLGSVRFNSVSPGITETPLLAEFYESMGREELEPLTARAGGRNGTPHEVASVVHFLASAAASWVNGTDLPVDHGAGAAEFLAAHGLIEPIGAS